MAIKRMLGAVLFLMCLGSAAGAPENSWRTSYVAIVNELGDKIQYVEWSANLDLIHVVVKRSVQVGSAKRVYLFSSGKSLSFDFKDVEGMVGTNVNPGDLVVIGTISPERLEKLRANSSFGDLLKAGLPRGHRPD